jgi:hypothetical protein
MFHDAVKKQFQSRIFVIEMFPGDTFATDGVQYRKIQLILVGVQIDEKAVYFVENFFGPGIVAINFIDDGDKRQSQVQGFFSTKRVCGKGPSEASTRRIAPFTMLSARSTSPPKSAWPGVSRMFTLTLFHCTAQFFAAMVIPRSRSRSIESMTRSSCFWFARNTPAVRNSASTNVVFPWSTWAMIATFRMLSLIVLMSSFCIPVLILPSCEGQLCRYSCSRALLALDFNAG